MDDDSEVETGDSSMFFSTGRGQSIVRSLLDQLLLKDEHNQLLESLKGEWNAVYFKHFVKRLVFARDIFGRKSLCWKLEDCGKDGGKWLTISVFPGEVHIPGNASCDWHEVHPGTFFVLKLSEDEAETAEFLDNDRIHASNSKDFRCRLFCGYFQKRSLQVVSFFPETELAGDPFLKLFSSVEYSHLDASHILQPSGTLAPIDQIEELVEKTAIEFNQRLKGAIKGFRIEEEMVQRGEACVQVLFSGGVDSLMIALQLGNVVPAHTNILLINAAFGDTEKDCAAAPDRKRGIKAFHYLKSKDLHDHELFGRNKYTLVLVNVGKSELIECRRKFIARAVAPLNSVLDDSLGCVLWFASRGKGIEYKEEKDNEGDAGKNFHLKGSIFVGSGADEQLGGYARHRTIFQRQGFDGLAVELGMEMRRIGLRNFGRDDRVVGSHGKVALAPFLEEQFVEWLHKVPLSIKVDFSLQRGFGEKRLLRRALIQLGVPVELASSPKQAMQFGSRIAKLENRGEKGSDTCDRLNSCAAD